MTKTTTTIWDPAVHLATTDDVAAYLEAALKDGDPQLVAAALGDIEGYLGARFATACQRY